MKSNLYKSNTIVKHITNIILFLKFFLAGNSSKSCNLTNHFAVPNVIHYNNESYVLTLFLWGEAPPEILINLEIY